MLRYATEGGLEGEPVFIHGFKCIPSLQPERFTRCNPKEEQEAFYRLPQGIVPAPFPLP
jgi:hypothetical protein